MNNMNELMILKEHPAILPVCGRSVEVVPANSCGELASDLLRVRESLCLCVCVCVCVGGWVGGWVGGCVRYRFYIINLSTLNPKPLNPKTETPNPKESYC